MGKVGWKNYNGWEIVQLQQLGKVGVNNYNDWYTDCCSFKSLFNDRVTTMNGKSWDEKLQRMGIGF